MARTLTCTAPVRMCVIGNSTSRPLRSHRRQHRRRARPGAPPVLPVRAPRRGQDWQSRRSCRRGPLTSAIAAPTAFATLGMLRSCTCGHPAQRPRDQHVPAADQDHRDRACCSSSSGRSSPRCADESRRARPYDPRLVEVGDLPRVADHGLSRAHRDVSRS
jgi:hypothetical protein